MKDYDGVTYRTCRVCLGCGSVSDLTCSTCEGTGVEPTAEALRLMVRAAEALDVVRSDLSAARWAMRSALACLDAGRAEDARLVLAAAVGLSSGPVDGGEE